MFHEDCGCCCCCCCCWLLFVVVVVGGGGGGGVVVLLFFEMAADAADTASVLNLCNGFRSTQQTLVLSATTPVGECHGAAVQLSAFQATQVA